MDSAEQVCILYAGVRGFLDKLHISEIAKFEALYLDHLKTNHQNLLDDIKKTGKLSPETDKAFKTILETFIPASGLRMKA